MWLAVDKDGTECIFNDKPNRDLIRHFYNNGDNHYFWSPSKLNGKIILPKGTIKKLIGKEITWRNPPIKIEKI